MVAYAGDDERFDYMYKFVSAKKVQPGTDPAAMAHNLTLLDEGTLYVAKLSSDIPADEIDGSGKLPKEGGSVAPEPGSRCCGPAPTGRASRSSTG